MNVVLLFLLSLLLHCFRLGTPVYSGWDRSVVTNATEYVVRICMVLVLFDIARSKKSERDRTFVHID